MNRTGPNALALMTFLVAVAGATAQAQPTGGATGVRDRAGMFSEGAVKEADAALKDVRRKTHWSALVETVDTLDGKTVKDAAMENARALQEHGLYVLIAKKEHKFYAEPSRSASKAFNHDAIKALDDAITAAFKAGKFDQGLRDAVALIRHDAEASPDVNTAKAPVAVAAPKAPTAPKPPTPPTPPSATHEGASPAPTVTPVAKTREPEPAPASAPVAETESMLPILLIGGGAVLLVLWLLSRAFRGGSRSAQTYPQPGPGVGVNYGPGVPQSPGPGGYAPQPQGRPVYPNQQPQVRPGYAPQQPMQPGYAPPAQPGYGYAPPPQQGGGGGGFLSGVLGGAAGAVAGNILYDKFGRPHEGQGAPPHVPGGAGFPPHQASTWPQGDENPAPPAESYDPDAGGGGDWGSSEPVVVPAPDTGAGGDWGTPEPVADPGAGGDWGTPEPVADPGAGGDWGAPEPEPTADAGGDWSVPDEPADAGGGGDWGGGGDSGTDDNQGGSW